MYKMRGMVFEDDFNFPSPGNKNKNKDKSARRMLRARRAIEEYFEERHLKTLSGQEYWEALC